MGARLKIDEMERSRLIDYSRLLVNFASHEDTMRYDGTRERKREKEMLTESGNIKTSSITSDISKHK